MNRTFWKEATFNHKWIMHIACNIIRSLNIEIISKVKYEQTDCRYSKVEMIKYCKNLNLLSMDFPVFNWFFSSTFL